MPTETTAAAEIDLMTLLMEMTTAEFQAAVAAEQAARPLGIHGPEEADDLASSYRWAARQRSPWAAQTVAVLGGYR